MLMYKSMKIILLSAMLCCSGVFFGQHQGKFRQDNANPSYLDYYKVAYELKDFILTDASKSIIETIDFAQFEAMRQENVDVEIPLVDQNKILILYSKEKLAFLRDKKVISDYKNLNQ